MKRRFLYIIVFTGGIIVGIASCMALAFYNIHKEMGRALIGPRIFGDIRIVPQFISKERCPNLDFDEHMLFLEKNGVNFMLITQDSNGVTKNINTLTKGNPDNGGFMMQPLKSPGQWECCYGGPSINGKLSGELYWDFNFDGQFDARYAFDTNGKKETSWIFVNGDWHKVIGAGHRYAKDDSTTFHFDLSYSKIHPTI